MITLSEAISKSRLPDFIAQEEARGIGPADPRALDALVAEAAKERQSEDQASHSPSGGGSTGK
jgi:hypothetical protein